MIRQRPLAIKSYGSVRAGSDVIVWAHGGSWMHGSIEAWDSAYTALSAVLPVPLIALGYPTSIESAFPTQLDALRGQVAQVRALIGESGRLLVGGDSAGGTLMAHVALTSPELVDGQLLAYPPMDPHCEGASFENPGFPSRHHMQSAWTMYAGSRTSEGLSRCTPLAARVSSRVPPASLLVGQADPVRSDVERYAEHLRNAGVTARVDVRTDVGHGDFLALRSSRPRAVHEWIAGECLRHLKGRI